MRQIDLHAVADHARFGRFHAITLCPIDRKLVDKSLMTRDQVEWLNAYHKRVYKELAPALTRAEKVWLKKATRPI